MLISAFRHLRNAINEDFISFLAQHAFVEVTCPQFEAKYGKFAVLYRGPVFELMLTGRARDDISVSGCPLYRREDWYSLPAVLAVIEGSIDAVGMASLADLRNKMEDAYTAIEHFFSVDGEDERKKVPEWEEAHYWRRMKQIKANKGDATLTYQITRVRQNPS